MQTIDTINPTILLAIELSASTWLVAARVPGSEKPHLHRIDGGDTAALLALISSLQARAARGLDATIGVVCCFEAGRDGFWLHRLLTAHGVVCHVLEPTSILVNRRARRAKTDRLDAEGMLRVLAAYLRGDHQACSMVRVPTPEEEDAKRTHREREKLVQERLRIENRIEALLLCMMNWSRFYGFKSYLKSSLWLVPFVAIPLELVTTRLLHGLDAWLGWSFLGFTQAGARAMLEAFVTITLSFVVFTFGSLLVAIQVASAQLTPRLIATTLLRNRVVKYTVGLFIFTLMFALSAQNLMDKEVHQLVMLLATLLGISSFAAFFHLIDYASRLLRPISVLAHVGAAGMAVTERVYPEVAHFHDVEGERFDLGPPAQVIRHQGTSPLC